MPQVATYKVLYFYICLSIFMIPGRATYLPPLDPPRGPYLSGTADNWLQITIP